MSKRYCWLAALALLAPTPARAQAPGSAAGQPQEGVGKYDRRQMAEDVEILRRLLNRALREWQFQALYPTAGAREVAFSPDGKLLTTREDGTARLWDPRT